MESGSVHAGSTLINGLQLFLGKGSGGVRVHYFSLKRGAIQRTRLPSRHLLLTVSP